MPLVTAAVLAYGAGLLAGFGVAPWLMPFTTWAVAWAAGEGRRERLALVALAVAGLAVARVSLDAEGSCRRTQERSARWVVTLDAAAAPGAFVGGRVACGTRMRLAVRGGRADAGATVLARGEAAPARDAVLVRDADVRVLRGPGPLRRWRAAVGRGIDERFGANAPLVRALLIADMRDLAPAVRDRFAASGLSHMLSVSGLHVGLIAMAVALLVQIAGIGRRRGDALVVALTGAYVAVIGAPLPAVRAAVMLAVASVSRSLQRPTSVWAALAVSALLPLLDPRSAADLGFQLSMVGMVALVAAGALSRRVPWLGQGGWRGTLARGIATSVLATMLTSPLVAATFGRVSLVAPLTNVVAVPVMAVLQPALFLAAALLPFGPAAQFIADATQPMLAAIDRIAQVGASLPGSSVAVATDEWGILLSSGAALALVLACVVRAPVALLMTAGACLAALAWRPVLPARGGWVELHMIDVGQGDAVALRTGAGRWVLFDAGRDWSGGDAGRRDVVPYLARRGGRLEGFVLSHPHANHFGGAASVIRAMRPAWYLDPGYAGGTPAYRASLVSARESGVSWRRARPGDSLRVDDVTITFLAPDSTWAEGLRDPNDASAVALVRAGTVTMLLAGDAEAGEEEWLLRHQRALLDVDVLKVAHHGSGTSSTAAFLAAATPRLALVSVGAGNVYRHPSGDVLRALAAHGAVVLRTDLEGTVVVRTDGRWIEVEAAGERWRVR